MEAARLEERIAKAARKRQAAPGGLETRGVRPQPGERVGMMPKAAQPRTEKPGFFMAQHHKAEAARRGASESAGRMQKYEEGIRAGLNREAAAKVALTEGATPMFPGLPLPGQPSEEAVRKFLEGFSR